MHLVSVLEGEGSWSSPVSTAITEAVEKKTPDFEVMKDAAVILNVSDLPTVVFHQLQNEHAEN